MACLAALWSAHNPAVTNAVIMNTNGPPDLLLEPLSAFVSADSHAEQVTDRVVRPPPWHGRPRMADVGLTEALRFRSLPRRPAVNIRFRVLGPGRTLVEEWR
ncbi:ATP-binding cassette sub-family G member 1 [Syngnathus typhle]|uniref:ATP-binding cassette sub-family G member 1 n=1 Tax=Syngnathus typhle TaxID=161592 RepID=UPI002A6A02C7|nr:ATP-binding cassette sub-family G member 1 [Syngnathus typhle]